VASGELVVEPEETTGRGAATGSVVLAVVMVAVMFAMGYQTTWFGFAYGAQLLPLLVGAFLWFLLCAGQLVVAIAAIASGSRRARFVGILSIVVAIGGSAGACPAGLSLGARYGRQTAHPFPKSN
jgi:hypothetical protein